MKNEIIRKRKNESGQIIVLLAVSLVVVMIVAALAVDGGMIYSERRFAQNTADAASLAGGGDILHFVDKKFSEESPPFVCPIGSTYDANTHKFTVSENIIASAVLAAKENAEIQNNISELPFLGYYINGSLTPVDGELSNPNSDLNDNHGITVECIDNVNLKYINVIVRNTSRISTAFAHLIFPGDLVTTNEAVTKIEMPHNIAFGNAIVSLSDKCAENKDGMYFSGNNLVTVSGGSIFSNSCLDGDGNVEVSVTQPTEPDEEADGIYLTYPWVGENKPDFSPDPKTVDEPVVIDKVFTKPKECETNGSLDSVKKTYSSGNYEKIAIQNGTYLFEEGGKFCLSGTAQNTLEITGGTVIGHNVFFYIEKGSVKISGNATVQLTAPSDRLDPYFGMLFYMPESNTGLINLVGNDESFFSGTVLAPKGKIEIGGTSKTDTQCKLILDENLQPIPDPEDPGYFLCEAGTFSTQLIGWYVKVVGTSNMDILFNQAKSGWIEELST